MIIKFERIVAIKILLAVLSVAVAFYADGYFSTVRAQCTGQAICIPAPTRCSPRGCVADGNPWSYCVCDPDCPQGTGGNYQLVPCTGTTSCTYRCPSGWDNCGAAKSCALVTPTPASSCTTSAWSSQGCGLGNCSDLQMYQTRTVNPSGCATTTRCIADNSCNTCSFGNWVDQDCGLGGCTDNQMLQTRTANPVSCEPKTRCVDSLSCETTSLCEWTSWLDRGCEQGGCNSNEMYQSRTVNPGGCATSTRCITDSTCETLPGGCDVTSWTNRGCGQGSCSSTQMYQTRTVNPSGCASASQCINDPSCSSCSFGSWIDQGCGANGCPTDNMSQTRTADPSTCRPISQCIYDAVCAIPPPSCTISGGNRSLYIGQTIAIYPAVNPQNGSVSSVTYTIPANTTLSICPADGMSTPCPAGRTSVTDSAASFGFKVTGFHQGIQNVTITATVSGDGGTDSCTNSTPFRIEVENTDPWWQAVGGGIISTHGEISSPISSICVPSSNCYPYLIMNEVGSLWQAHPNPGIPVVESGRSVSIPSGSSISTEQWNVRGGNYATSIGKYDYDNFVKKMPVSSPDTAVNATVLQSACGAGNSYQDYCVYRHNSSDLTLSDPDGVISIGDRKVVLFVSGDLTIQSKISVNNGRGFFMALTGGNINVSPTVSGSYEIPNPVPDLEGIFFAQGTFNTGRLSPEPACNDDQLHVRGSVVARTGVALQRCMENNTISPAELFEFAPDLYIRFPSFLGKPAIDWSEVEP